MAVNYQKKWRLTSIKRDKKRMLRIINNNTAKTMALTCLPDDFIDQETQFKAVHSVSL